MPFSADIRQYSVSRNLENAAVDYEYDIQRKARNASNVKAAISKINTLVNVGILTPTTSSDKTAATMRTQAFKAFKEISADDLEECLNSLIDEVLEHRKREREEPLEKCRLNIPSLEKALANASALDREIFENRLTAERLKLKTLEDELNAKIDDVDSLQRERDLITAEINTLKTSHAPAAKDYRTPIQRNLLNTNRAKFLSAKVSTDLGSLDEAEITGRNLDFTALEAVNISLDPLDDLIGKTKTQIASLEKKRDGLVPRQIYYLERLPELVNSNPDLQELSRDGKLESFLKNGEASAKADPEYEKVKARFGGELTAANFDEFFQAVGGGDVELNPAKIKLDTDALTYCLTELNSEIDAATKANAKKWDSILFNPLIMMRGSSLPAGEEKGKIKAKYRNIAKAIGADLDDSSDIKAKFKEFFAIDATSKKATIIAEKEAGLITPESQSTQELKAFAAHLNSIKSPELSDRNALLTHLKGAAKTVTLSDQEKAFLAEAKKSMEGTAGFSDLYSKDALGGVKLKAEKLSELIEASAVSKSETDDAEAPSKANYFRNFVEKDPKYKRMASMLPLLGAVVQKIATDLLSDAEAKKLSFTREEVESCLETNDAKELLFKEDALQNLDKPIVSAASEKDEVESLIRDFVATETYTKTQSNKFLPEPQLKQKLFRDLLDKKSADVKRLGLTQDNFTSCFNDDDLSLNEEKLAELVAAKKTAKSASTTSAEKSEASPLTSIMTEFTLAMKVFEEGYAACNKDKDKEKTYLDEFKATYQKEVEAMFASPKIIELYKQSLSYSALQANDRYKYLTPPLSEDDIDLYKSFGQSYQAGVRLLVLSNSTAIDPNVFLAPIKDIAAKSLESEIAGHRKKFSLPLITKLLEAEDESTKNIAPKVHQIFSQKLFQSKKGFNSPHTYLDFLDRDFAEKNPETDPKDNPFANLKKLKTEFEKTMASTPLDEIDAYVKDRDEDGFATRLEKCLNACRGNFEEKISDAALGTVNNTNITMTISNSYKEFVALCYNPELAIIYFQEVAKTVQQEFTIEAGHEIEHIFTQSDGSLLVNSAQSVIAEKSEVFDYTITAISPEYADKKHSLTSLQSTSSEISDENNRLAANAASLKEKLLARFKDDGRSPESISQYANYLHLGCNPDGSFPTGVRAKLSGTKVMTEEEKKALVNSETAKEIEELKQELARSKAETTKLQKAAKDVEEAQAKVVELERKLAKTGGVLTAEEEAKLRRQLESATSLLSAKTEALSTSEAAKIILDEQVAKLARDLEVAKEEESRTGTPNPAMTDLTNDLQTAKEKLVEEIAKSAILKTEKEALELKAASFAEILIDQDDIEGLKSEILAARELAEKAARKKLSLDNQDEKDATAAALRKLNEQFNEEHKLVENILEQNPELQELLKRKDSELDASSNALKELKYKELALSEKIKTQEDAIAELRLKIEEGKTREADLKESDIIERNKIAEDRSDFELKIKEIEAKKKEDQGSLKDLEQPLQKAQQEFDEKFSDTKSFIETLHDVAKEILHPAEARPERDHPLIKSLPADLFAEVVSSKMGGKDVFSLEIYAQKPGSKEAKSSSNLHKTVTHEDLSLQEDQILHSSHFGKIIFDERAVIKDEAGKNITIKHPETGAKMRSGIFNGADLKDSSFRGCVFKNVDFSEIKNIETLKFAGCEFEGCTFPKGLDFDGKNFNYKKVTLSKEAKVAYSAVEESRAKKIEINGVEILEGDELRAVMKVMKGNEKGNKIGTAIHAATTEQEFKLAGTFTDLKTPPSKSPKPDAKATVRLSGKQSSREL